MNARFTNIHTCELAAWHSRHMRPTTSICRCQLIELARISQAFWRHNRKDMLTYLQKYLSSYEMHWTSQEGIGMTALLCRRF
jgi:hypothetical protein